MSRTQRTRRLRRRQAAARTPRTTPPRAAVAFTGSLLVAAGLAVTPPAAHADDSDVGLVEVIGKHGSRPLPKLGAVLGDDLLLPLDDGEHGLELWRTDGSEVGTQLVKDIHPSTSEYYSYSITSPLVRFGDHVYFRAWNGSTGNQLWRSDGTTAGTEQVSDLPTLFVGIDYDYGPRELTVVGDTLFFANDDGETGSELWASDGTRAGTHQVVDLDPGLGGSAPVELTAVGDTLYFTANTTGFGRELWRSDGTAAGTTRLSDVAPGPQSSYPAEVTAIGDTVFAATDPAVGRELWSSDGTVLGTSRVADVRLGTGSSDPAFLTDVGGRLYFGAADGSTGRELWSSDGTAAGTQRVADVRAGLEGGDPFYLTPLGDDGDLVFSADDGVHGRELWRSDGTAAGTALLRDADPRRTSRGPRSSLPTELLPVGDDVWFTALTAVGRELWRTDGTTAGTELFADVSKQPGVYASYGVTQLTAVGSTLYFTADDGVHGTQLWSTAAAATAIPRAVNRTRPRITGRPVPGQVLTASPGRWTPSGTTYRYQWYRDGLKIDGATGRTFRVRPTLGGARVTVAVIASKRGIRAALAVSDPTAKVKPGKPIRNLRRPAVRGAVRVGSRLTATVGRWKQRGLRFAFEWYADGVSTGVTRRSFLLRPGSVGRRIAVKVTARKPLHAPESVRSRPTAPVRR